MDKGIYVSLLPKGKIKRTLTMESGEVELPETTIADEVILFSELNFEYYAQVVELLNTIANAIPSPPKDLTQEEVNAFDLLLDTTEDLVTTLEQEDLLRGTLTRTLLEDVLPPDCTSPASADQTKKAILRAASDPMRFQFFLNSVLYDMRDGIALDLDQKYRILKEVIVSQHLILGDELSSRYHFRSASAYYCFLLLHFIVMKPRVLLCQCCGRYFIPKTKKETLYCDRIFKRNRTCKQVAPGMKHQIEAMKQTVIDEFDRAKRRMYKRYKVGFFACYDRVWELVNLRNDKQHYQEGFFVFDIATFNERVVREAILNAVSHRNYQFGGSIFVRQFRDRLVVESPGGLPFGITLDNILDRQLPRNRRIAEILSLCGMVERSGQGMNLMFELSVQEAKPLPDFTGTDDFFVSVTLNGLIIDKAMLSVINRISERCEELLSTEDFLAINALYHERPLDEKMQSRLNRLIDMGIVEHIGRKKYVLARSLYAATGKTGVHTRHVGLDRDTNKELLLKHIRQNNEVGTPFKELQQVLPGLNRNQIQVLMRELKKDGKVVCKGKTHAAKWYVSQ